MHDGAPPHIASPVTGLLHATFSEHNIIGRFCINAWPTRSPDLTPCDFWLWGFLKARVYRIKPRSLGELKESIKREVHSIPEDMLLSSVNNVIPRLLSALEQQGGPTDI